MTVSIAPTEFRPRQQRVVKRWDGDFGYLCLVLEAFSGLEGRQQITFGAVGYRVRAMVKAERSCCSCLEPLTLRIGTNFVQIANHDFGQDVVYWCARTFDLAWAVRDAGLPNDEEVTRMFRASGPIDVELELRHDAPYDGSSP